MPIKLHHTKRILLAIIVAVFVLLGAWAYVEKTFAHVALPGVKVLGIKVGGKAQSEIVEILNKKYDEATRDGLQFTYKNRVANIYPEVVATNDPDLFYQLFKINVEQTATNLVNFGHHGNPFRDIPEIIMAFTAGYKTAVDYTLFENALITALKENFGDLERPAQNPRPQFRAGEIEFSESKPGISFNFRDVADALRPQIANLKFEKVTLTLAKDEPKVTKEEVIPLSPQIKHLADSLPLILTFEGHQWTVSRNEFLRWLDFKKNKDGISLELQSAELFKFLNTVRKGVDQKPIDAKFKIENGKVVEFQGSHNGRIIDYEKTSALLTNALLDENSEKTKTIEVASIALEPRITTSNVNDIGITEIIGIGRSNFRGSPPNRIHNIRTGAAAVNGILIKPDEEFSMLKTIGQVNAENGYLPELVIKGNKTTREFGGGLCQIGTTMFRGTLASGLPITQRQNHSYRVPYYEPAGTDATIYDPAPDYKFKNDTGHYILVQTKVIGSDLTFEFWGTKDGRKAEQSTPIVYNIVKPEEPLLTPTEDLAVGEKRCSERAHDGADAKLTYTVTYADNKQVVKEFKSHYKPWREVCLIGVPKGTLPPELTASSLDGNLPSSDASGASAR